METIGDERVMGGMGRAARGSFVRVRGGGFYLDEFDG